MKLAFKPEKYVELSYEERDEKYEEILTEWQLFLASENCNLVYGKDYFIHKRNLFEIIRRCDKRRVYMEMFHDLKDICEYKTLAVECFWINTLKPFMVINEESSIYNCPNEMFCLYRILAVIRKTYKKKFPDKEFYYPSPERIKDIVYDLKYCSLNREAMVAFIETLADTYEVGISYIFEIRKLKEQQGGSEQDE